MPSRPMSHEERLRRANPDLARAQSRAARAERLANPAQAAAERVRSSRQWKDLRAQVLAEEPLCRPCRERGLTVAATTVDHIVPLVDRPELAFERTNLQPLDTACHASKTAREIADRRARGPVDRPATEPPARVLYLPGGAGDPPGEGAS